MSESSKFVVVRCIDYCGNYFLFFLSFLAGIGLYDITHHCSKNQKDYPENVSLEIPVSEKPQLLPDDLHFHSLPPVQLGMDHCRIDSIVQSERDGDVITRFVNPLFRVRYFFVNSVHVWDVINLFTNSYVLVPNDKRNIMIIDSYFHAVRLE